MRHTLEVTAAASALATQRSSSCSAATVYCHIDFSRSLWSDSNSTTSSTPGPTTATTEKEQSMSGGAKEGPVAPLSARHQVALMNSRMCLAIAVVWTIFDLW